jgi:hypothetical protein
MLVIWVRVMKLKCSDAFRIPTINAFTAHQSNGSFLYRALSLSGFVVDTLFTPVHALMFGTLGPDVEII